MEYFDTSVPRWTGSLDDLIGDTPLSKESRYLLGKFKCTSFPMQVVRVSRPYEGERLVLSYGNCPHRSPVEWLTSVVNFPEELWFSVEEYQRPTRPALLLCDYRIGHYEVVEYSNQTWTTELCFPVKPKRYFVLDFLDVEDE